MKLLTLNVWRYYQWERRKDKLVSLLKDENPDVIFLEEVTYDERLKDKWKNQVDEINESLGYDFSLFEKTEDLRELNKEPINWEMYYGLGILSKYKIKSSEKVILPFVERNRRFGFVHAVVETPKNYVDLIVVHFENTDAGSKKHLRQTLDWCKKKGLEPIIAGDFNMKITDDLKELAEDDYEISYFVKPYKSFNPTEFSNDKVPITLDYILVHKKKFEFENVECLKRDISDHNPVIGEIKIR